MRAKALAIATAVAAALVAPATAASATPQQDAAAFAAVTTHATVTARGKDGEVKREIADYLRSIQPCADEIPSWTSVSDESFDPDLIKLGVALFAFIDRVYGVTAPLEKRFATELVAVGAQDPVLRRAAYAWRRTALQNPFGTGEQIDVCATLAELDGDSPALPELEDLGELTDDLDAVPLNDFDRILAGRRRLLKLGVSERVANRFLDPIASSLPRIDRAIERLFGPLGKTRQRELLRIR